MKGYKGMDENMQCRGFQYEVGKTYRIAGEVALCRNGFHFCEKLPHVFSYCTKNDSRFFEIEANGTIYSDGKKSVAEKITIIRELPGEEVNRAFYGHGFGHRCNNDPCYSGHGYTHGHGQNPNFGDGNGDGNGNGCLYTSMNIQQILIFN